MSTQSRRMFLRGVGGATLSIPFLPSLLSPSTANAASAPPLRFMFVGGYFGRDLRRWYPSQETNQVSPEGVPYLALSEIKGPISYTLDQSFDPVRGKISLLRGLDSMQHGDAHNPTVPLTGSAGFPNGPGFGVSLDTVLEQSGKFYPELPSIPGLRTCPNLGETRLSFSYTAKTKPGQPVWVESDPRTIYDKYFNPATLATTATDNAHKRGIINQVMGDYKAVMGGRRIGESDQRKLDNYMTLLADAERRLTVPLKSCARGTAPGAYTTAETLHETVANLEVAALACGLTKIVCHTVLHYDSDAIFTAEPAHGDAHKHVGLSVKGELTDHAKHNRWSLARVSQLLTKLDAVEESNGTLLDNTLFLYGNTEARGFHSQYDMPVIIAGASNVLRTGYYIDYRPQPLRVISPSMEVEAGRPYNQLLISIFKAFGLGASDYRRFDKKGFGVYDQYDKALADHYAPFLKDFDQELPFLRKT